MPSLLKIFVSSILFSLLLFFCFAVSGGRVNPVSVSLCLCGIPFIKSVGKYQDPEKILLQNKEHSHKHGETVN